MREMLASPSLECKCVIVRARLLRISLEPISRKAKPGDLRPLGNSGFLKNCLDACFFKKLWTPQEPLPTAPRADFLKIFLKNPPPQGAKRPGGAAEGGARGIFGTVSKKSAPGEGDFQKYFKKSAPGEGHFF